MQNSDDDDTFLCLLLGEIIVSRLLIMHISWLCLKATSQLATRGDIQKFTAV